HRPENVGRFAAIVLEEYFGCFQTRFRATKGDVITIRCSSNNRFAVPLPLQANGLANLYLTLQPVYFRSQLDDGTSRRFPQSIVQREKQLAPAWSIHPYGRPQVPPPQPEERGQHTARHQADFHGPFDGRSAL